MDAEAVKTMRQALEALETLGRREAHPVQQAILRLRDNLGEAADAVGAEDPLYPDAVQYVLRTRRASMSSLQLELKCGYSRVRKMMEAMRDCGLLVPGDPWLVLAPQMPELKVVNGKD